jgi:hypothetical protein
MKRTYLATTTSGQAFRFRVEWGNPAYNLMVLNDGDWEQTPIQAASVRSEWQAAQQIAEYLDFDSPVIDEVKEDARP